MVSHSRSSSLPETRATADTSRADTQQSQSRRDNVFIITGPGAGGPRAPKHEISEAYGDAFRSRGAHVGVFGNGHDAESLDSLSEAFGNFMVNPEEDATIFLVCHGDYQKGSHYLKFEDEQELNTPTASVLRAICPTVEGCGKRDVFFAACASRSALSEIESLPKGSEGVSLADHGESLVLAPGFPDAIRNGSGPLSANRLLDTYLVDAMSNSTWITSAVSGAGKDLHSHNLNRRVGGRFSLEEKDAVHQRWDSELGSRECDELMSFITSASAPYQIWASK